jgi:thiamine-phosphate pyrophosphorylase
MPRCLLYYITDRSQFGGDERTRRRALLDKIEEAASCGVDYVQLREKDLGARELERLTRDALRAIRGACGSVGNEAARTRLLVNSRVDVALAAGADGVHLRSEDVSVKDVRRILEVAAHERRTDGGFVVACSCHTADDIFRAVSEGADFAVFAPVFEKKDSPGTRPAGLAELREACRTKIPVIALGGVNAENVASCLEAGTAGIAAIRLFQENTIEDVVRALRAF